MRRAIVAGVVVAGGLAAPGAASAGHVNQLKPWGPGHEYLSEANLDGRPLPQAEPIGRPDHVTKGQWVRITCQATGPGGYKVWSKVGGWYVPTKFLKTYTEGFLPGVPRCETGITTEELPPEELPPPPEELPELLDPSGDLVLPGLPAGDGEPPAARSRCGAPVAVLGRGRARYYATIFRRPCARLDEAYRAYGSGSGGQGADPTESRRRRIDVRFRAGMRARCRAVFPGPRRERRARTRCLKAAAVFYRVIRIGGEVRFFG